MYRACGVSLVTGDEDGWFQRRKGGDEVAGCWEILEDADGGAGTVRERRGGDQVIGLETRGSSLFFIVDLNSGATEFAGVEGVEEWVELALGSIGSLLCVGSVGCVILSSGGIGLVKVFIAIALAFAFDSAGGAEGGGLVGVKDGGEEAGLV